MSDNFPFRKFKVKIENYHNNFVYHIEKYLSDDLLLIRVSLNSRLGYSRWRIGRFVYEDGIGGRKILDTNHFNFIGESLPTVKPLNINGLIANATDGIIKKIEVIE